MKQHILVIGGAGYVGSVLVRRLLAQGYKVSVLDALLYDNGFSIQELMEHPDFRFVKGDFGDKKLLSEMLQGVTDVVLLAALVGDPICKKYPELARKVNLEYAKEAFLLAKTSGVNRFVFTSTCSNYGLQPDDSPAHENSELAPQSLYAETKVAFEQFVLSQADESAFAPVLLRLSTAFGLSPRMRFDLTISEFTRTVAVGNALKVYDAQTWRPYCHLQDIASTILALLDAPLAKIQNQVFNVGHDSQNHTKEMVVQHILTEYPHAEVEYVQGGKDTRNYKVSFAKLEAHFPELKLTHTVQQNVKSILSCVANGLFQDIDTFPNHWGNYTIEVG